jgi:hypothetical protein
MLKMSLTVTIQGEVNIVSGVSRTKNTVAKLYNSPVKTKKTKTATDTPVAVGWYDNAVRLNQAARKKKANKKTEAVELERAVPYTILKTTPTGATTTKELSDSWGNVFPSVEAAANFYGCPRYKIYNALSCKGGRLSPTLVVQYTGNHIPRWYYYSRRTQRTYANIYLASVGENVPQDKIRAGIRLPEDQLNWEVLVPTVR